MSRNKTNPIINDIEGEVLYGLTSYPKRLPSKLFYDSEGSKLFDKICELEEYYPTRTEMEIMRSNIAEITSAIRNTEILIEPGSGSSKKTRLLFDNLPKLKTYVPVDISEEFLIETCGKINNDYPKLNVIPVCTDYTTDTLTINGLLPEGSRVIYYPGSTIGNFEPEEVPGFLRRMSDLLGHDGGLLIGVDLKKRKPVLTRAYNDSKGITAEFNLNILKRINRELNADFNTELFEHRAVYNARAGRIEMYLISKAEQTVKVCSRFIHFKQGEHILTEHSYKYTIEEFSSLIKDSFIPEIFWTDKDKLFSVQYFRAAKTR